MTVAIQRGTLVASIDDQGSCNHSDRSCEQNHGLINNINPIWLLIPFSLYSTSRHPIAYFGDSDAKIRPVG